MPTDLGLSGQHADSTTGLDYFKARYYDLRDRPVPQPYRTTVCAHMTTRTQLRTDGDSCRLY